MNNSNDDQLPAYLRDCLNDIARSERFADGPYTIRCAEGSKNGDGFIASIVGVTIRSELPADHANYRDELCLVMKLLPDNASRRQFFSSVKLFAREAHFYNNIVPALKTFQQLHGLDADTGFFAFPHCFAARADADTNEFYIVMEDIRQRQFALHDRNRSLRVEHVRLLFKQLGRFHGLSFAMRDQQPQQFQALVDGSEEIWLQMTEQEVFRKMIAAGYDSTMSMLTTDRHLAVMKRLRANWLDQWKRCLKKGAAGRWTVIGHGDCWNNNLMFSGLNEAADPTEIRLLDWQMARFGSPMLDVMYFLFTSTDRQLRDEHLEQLLHDYHAACSQVIEACGSDAELLFSFENVMEHIKEFGVHGLSLAPMIVGIMVSESENINDMDEYANAMDAQIRNGEDSVGYFLKFDERSKAVFVDRIGAVIDDAIRLKCVEL